VFRLNVFVFLVTPFFANQIFHSVKCLVFCWFIVVLWISLYGVFYSVYSVNATILVVFFVLVKNMLIELERFTAAAVCSSCSIFISYKYNYDMCSVSIGLIFVLLPQSIDTGKYACFA
jgi:hypothetical protein